MNKSGRVNGILVIMMAAVFFSSGYMAFAGGIKDTPNSPVKDNRSSETGKAAGRGGKVKPVNLVFWWWGEQEAPGLGTWLRETVELFQEANPGITVETVLMETENVIGDFIAAAAAGNPPDLQFLWNGIYHMENAWRGYLEPLNGLIPDDALARMPAGSFSEYQGKQYMAGWYVMPMGIMYNRKLFREAGVPEDMTPPRTFDDLLKASALLKSRGIIPMAAGFKDGFWGEWFAGFGLAQNQDHAKDTVRLTTGEYRWTDPERFEHWAKLEEYLKAGYVNEDADSLELYQGLELFSTGKAAMTQAVLALVPAAAKPLGSDNVGIMPWPAWGSGRLAGLPVIITRGVGIPSGSRHRKEAAKFLMFMNSQERLTALHEKVHVLPADPGWEGADRLESSVDKLQRQWYTGEHADYVCDLLGRDFIQKVLYPAPLMLLSGDMNPEDLALLAEETMARWRDENPELLGFLKKWLR